MLKQQCDDFRVEEVPSYVPTGDGEHLFLKIQKQDVAAGHLLKVLSHQLRISQRDIGVAGQKDRRAITIQYVSVPARCKSRLEGFQDDGVQILEVTPHGNKLRTGHLLGNRFRIVLRPESGEFSDHDLAAVIDSLKSCEQDGFPNYYGKQRFGPEGASILKGLQLVAGTASGKKAVKVSRFERKMLFSCVQAAVFNLVVADRVSAGTIHTASDGDVVCRRDGIRPFLYSERSDDFTEQLVPMGPMFGGKMLPSEAATQARELEILHSLGLTEDNFASRKDTPGTRRPMIAWPKAVTCERCDEGNLILEFELPAGSYATILLAEVVAQLIETS